MLAFHWSYNQRFLCVVFPPDAAVPLSVRVEREREGWVGWEGGWGAIDGKEERDREGERQGQRKQEKGDRGEEAGGEEGAHTCYSGRQAEKQAGRG